MTRRGGSLRSDHALSKEIGGDNRTGLSAFNWGFPCFDARFPYWYMPPPLPRRST